MTKSETVLKLEVKEKKRLKDVLSEIEVAQIQEGWLVASCEGQKLKLDDEVKGTVMVLSPLQAG